MIEEKIVDWFFSSNSNLAKGQARATSSAEPTALIVQGPAGVGKTFSISQAIKQIEAKVYAADRKAVFSWEIMEVDRDTPEERLAFLENLIFSAKSVNRKIKFRNYAFALAAYARRRRPGLKAHESHPEFNRMRKAVLGLGGAAGGAMLELLDDVGLGEQFDKALDLIEEYGSSGPEGFFSYAKSILSGVGVQVADSVMQQAGENATDSALDILEKRKGAFRQRVRKLSERDQHEFDPTKQLELMLPEAFALDCSLNRAQGVNLQIGAIIDRAEAVRSEHTISWIARLFNESSAVRVIFGERAGDKSQDTLKSRLLESYPSLDGKCSILPFQHNLSGVRKVLEKHNVPTELWPRVEDRAEGRPMYAKLWSEIFQRNLLKFGDVEKAADFLPGGRQIINYYFENMPESMRLQVELAALAPSLPIDAFLALLSSEGIGEGAARPEEVRDIGRATAAEGRIELHEELRHALISNPSPRRRRWLESKQYQLSLWALHRVALPDQNEYGENRTAYLGLFEATAVALNAERLSRLAVFARVANTATIGGVTDAVDLLDELIRRRHRDRTELWRSKLFQAASVLSVASKLVDGTAEVDQDVEETIASETDEAVVIQWFIGALQGKHEVRDRASLLALQYLSEIEANLNEPEIVDLVNTAVTLKSAFFELFPEFSVVKNTYSVPAVVLTKLHPIRGVNFYESALHILQLPERKVVAAILSRPWEDSFFWKSHQVLLPEASEPEKILARVLCPGQARYQTPVSYLWSVSRPPVARPSDHFTVANRITSLTESEASNFASIMFDMDAEALGREEPEMLAERFTESLSFIDSWDVSEKHALVRILIDEISWYQYMKHNLSLAWGDDDVLLASWRLFRLERDNTAPVPFDGGPRHLKPIVPKAVSFAAMDGIERAEFLHGGPLLWSIRRLGPREGIGRRAFLAKFGSKHAVSQHLKYLTGGFALEPKELDRYSLTRLARGEDQLIGYDEAVEAFEARTRVRISPERIMEDFMKDGDSLWKPGEVKSSGDEVAWRDLGWGLIHEVWQQAVREQYSNGKDAGSFAMEANDVTGDPYAIYSALEPISSDFEIEVSVEQHSFDLKLSPAFDKRVRLAQRVANELVTDCRRLAG